MLAQSLYRQHRYLWLTMIVILITGVVSVRSLGRQEDPSVTVFYANIATYFPGADPARVEALITRPLEKELREISEVYKLRSTSGRGVSLIIVELDDSLGDSAMELAWSEVRDATTDASRRFPAGASTPVFDNERMVPYVRIVGVRPASGQDLSPRLLSRIADDLTQEVRNFPGVRLVHVFGAAREEIRVDIDEGALYTRGISIAEVTAALAAADPRRAAGRSSGSVNDLLIEVAGEFTSTQRIASVIIRTDERGAAVTIGDVARVYRAEQTPPRSLAMADGERGILIAVAMEDGLQVDSWSAGFERFLTDYRATAPAGVDIESAYDQAVYTQKRLEDVIGNLALGMMLVLLVLFFTLGLRAAAVVAIVLPLCTLVSLVIMQLIALPIQQMSVTGLVVALGLLVDGSIVMTDEVRKRLLAGATREQAIAAAVTRLQVPLLSSTVTTILTFMPMILMPGPAGDFLGSIAKAVVIMLATSLLLALAVTPVLAAKLLPDGLQDSSWWARGVSGGAAGRALQRALAWSVRHPSGAVALALVLPLTGFLAFPTLTAQFFPGTNRDQMIIKLSLLNGRSIYDTQRLVADVDARLREESLIRRIDWTIGESPPGFYYNLRRSEEGRPEFAQASVLTRDASQTDDLIRRLQVELDEAYPEARIVVQGIEQGPPVEAPVEIELYGDDLETLRALGEQFRLRMERVPDITHTTTSLVAGAPKLVLNLDEQRLRLLGMDLSSVAETLDASLRGRTAGEVLDGTERLPVRAKLHESDWSDPEIIGSMELPLPRGTGAGPDSVSLSTLGEVTLQPSDSPITRIDGARANKIQGFVARGVLADEALEELRSILSQDPVPLPTGYRYSFGGSTDMRSRVVSTLVAPVGMVAAALLATIVLTFNSWRLSAITFSVCGLATGLSLLTLEVFQFAFGIQVLIGVIGSVGVSINAAIIILTALQADARARRGDPDAVCAIVLDSSRHIVSTTITTFGGFLPLILDDGYFWPPFAMAIAGGVLLSTVVSFFYVPPMFVLAYRWSNRRLPRLTSAAESAARTAG